ncbi:MAG TPA: hypothetical protein VGF21_07000 [Thermoleophilaceae bacterium]
MTRGRFTILVAATALVAIAAIIGLSIDFGGGDESGAKKNPEPASKSTPTATTQEPDHAEERRQEVSKVGSDPDMVRGSEEIALNRPANLRRALAVLEKRRVRAGGVFEDLRIAPGRIDTQVRNKHQIINLQVRPDFSIPISNTTPFAGDQDTIARGLRASDVNERAPSLLLRKIDRRRDTTTSAADLDYMVVDKGLIDHEIGWTVFLERGPRPRAWSAKGRSLDVSPIG